MHGIREGKGGPYAGAVSLYLKCCKRRQLVCTTSQARTSKYFFRLHKKLELAPKNESYLIHILQFLGLINKDGSPTDAARRLFSLGNEDFKQELSAVIRQSYSALFSELGDDAWVKDKDSLKQWFRTTDKTSEVIGTRQASVFIALSRLAGHSTSTDVGSIRRDAKPKGSKQGSVSSRTSKKLQLAETSGASMSASDLAIRRDVALTVRIEVNLPANCDQDTYDAIFKSIRNYLINEQSS